MKVKALITLVVGKGMEVAPNEVVDIAESEARRLLEKRFVETLPKDTSPRTRQTRQKPTTTPTPIDDNPDDGGDDGDSDDEGDNNDPDGEDGNDAV
jgi:hypothetical protein